MNSTENRDKFIELATFHIGCAEHHKKLAAEIEAMVAGSREEVRDLVIEDGWHHLREAERHVARAKVLNDLARNATKLLDSSGPSGAVN